MIGVVFEDLYDADQYICDSEGQTDADGFVEGGIKLGFDPHQRQKKIKCQQGEKIAERFSQADQNASSDGKMRFGDGGLLFYQQGKQEFYDQADGDGYAG